MLCITDTVIDDGAYCEKTLEQLNEINAQCLTLFNLNKDFILDATFLSGKQKLAALEYFAEMVREGFREAAVENLNIDDCEYRMSEYNAFIFDNLGLTISEHNAINGG